MTIPETITRDDRTVLDSRVRTAVLGAIRAEDGNWSIGSPLADRVMEALGPVLDEAEADRAKLAAVAALCRDNPHTLTAGDVLRIISSEEGADHG